MICTLCGMPIVQAKMEDGAILALDLIPHRLFGVDGLADHGLGVPTMARVSGYSVGYTVHARTCRGPIPGPPWAEMLAHLGMQLAAIGAVALLVEYADFNAGVHVFAWHAPPAARFRRLGGALTCAA